MQHHAVQVRGVRVLLRVVSQMPQGAEDARLDLVLHLRAYVVRTVLWVLGAHGRKFGLDEEVFSGADAGGDGFTDALAAEVFAVVSGLGRYVYAAEACGEGVVDVGGCGFFFPGAAVEVGGDSVGGGAGEGGFWGVEEEGFEEGGLHC